MKGINENHLNPNNRVKKWLPRHQCGLVIKIYANIKPESNGDEYTKECNNIKKGFL